MIFVGRILLHSNALTFNRKIVVVVTTCPSLANWYWSVDNWGFIWVIFLSGVATVPMSQIISSHCNFSLPGFHIFGLWENMVSHSHIRLGIRGLFMLVNYYVYRCGTPNRTSQFIDVFRALYIYLSAVMCIRLHKHFYGFLHGVRLFLLSLKEMFFCFVCEKVCVCLSAATTDLFLFVQLLVCLFLLWIQYELIS